MHCQLSQAKGACLFLSAEGHRIKVFKFYKRDRPSHLRRFPGFSTHRIRSSCSRSAISVITISKIRRSFSRGNSLQLFRASFIKVDDDEKPHKFISSFSSLSFSLSPLSDDLSLIFFREEACKSSCYTNFRSNRSRC